MTADLPRDSDGDALRGLVATGSDLSLEMEIDFAVSVPDETSGIAFAEIVGPMGFKTSVRLDTESQEWTCYCTLTMVPEYSEILEIQNLLDRVGTPYNAKSDGWGTFGNAQP